MYKKCRFGRDKSKLNRIWADISGQIRTYRKGQSIRYLNGADFRAQTMADYQFKGELIRRLGLGAQ